MDQIEVVNSSDITTIYLSIMCTIFTPTKNGVIIGGVSLCEACGENSMMVVGVEPVPGIYWPDNSTPLLLLNNVSKEVAVW